MSFAVHWEVDELESLQPCVIAAAAASTIKGATSRAVWKGLPSRPSTLLLRLDHAHDVRAVHVFAEVADLVVLDLDDPRVAIVVVVAVGELTDCLGLGADEV